MPGAFGTADETTLKQAALDEPGTDGQDLASVVSCTEPYTVGDGPRRVVAYDLGIKTHDPPPPRRAGHRRGRARRHAGGRRAGPRARRRLPVQRPRRPRRGHRHHRRPSGTCSARCRSSGSASATSCWPRPSAAPPTSCPSATTAGTTRCSDWRPAASRSPARTTTTPCRPTASATAPRSPTSTSTTASSRASAASTCRPSACSTTPRPGPGPTTPATCSTCFADLMDEALMPKRDDIESILLIGSGPDRHRPGLRVRLLGHPGLPRAAGGGLPGDPGQLEPGHDHDRPRLRRRHLRRAPRPRDPRPGSSSGSSPTPCCRRSAARPR